jgi:O-antigen/teichoic acid export membrane protein
MEGRRRLTTAMREGERVSPLELFFDLVFVLAITQCTALMAADPTWTGVAQGLLVLAVLWWSWAGYAWLTSVIDPEEGAVRLAFFAAMAAFLVVALCVPEAFDDLALTFAVAYLPLAFALQAPTWIFFRRMDFVRQRILQAIVPVVTICTTIPLAASGVGVWSLVIGPFVGTVAGVAATLKLSPYPLRVRVDPAARRRYLRFSWPIFVAAAALLAVQQGQLLAFDIETGLEGVGFVTLAFTLTRYADRADQIVATTIYPAICAVVDRTATLEELFVKSGRLTLMWVGGFCAGLILFAPDLVNLILGDEWEPAIVVIQGLAAAAALQQVGYAWFSFYRARGETRPQAVEAAVMVAAFALLALLHPSYQLATLAAGVVLAFVGYWVLRRRDAPIAVAADAPASQF